MILNVSKKMQTNANVTYNINLYIDQYRTERKSKINQKRLPKH